LKKQLTTSLVLVMPHMEKPFLIYFDVTMSRMCAYARWSHGSVFFMKVKEALGALSDP
jgi:hypothetical protein